MTTRLLLMRHAKSDWDSGVADDFLRPLNERGMHDARRMGQWLAAAGELPKSIISSPSRRTRQTLELLSAGAGIDLAERVAWQDELYHAGLTTLRALLSRWSSHTNLLVLAHNPGLEALYEFLVRGTTDHEPYYKLMPTAAIYILEMDTSLGSLQAGCARVLAHQRPKLLGT